MDYPRCSLDEGERTSLPGTGKLIPYGALNTKNKSFNFFPFSKARRLIKTVEFQGLDWSCVRLLGPANKSSLISVI